jgi:hypothetical protein
MSQEVNSTNGTIRLNGIGRIPSMSGVPREEDKNKNVVKGGNNFLAIEIYYIII